MTSYFHTTIGQREQFDRLLAKSGLTQQDVKSILADPGLAERMIEALRWWQESGWYRPPEQQLQRARQLWPGITLPEPPIDFVPRTGSEVLLLHVPDTVNSLFDKIVPPAGYIKEGRIEPDERHLRLAPNIPDRTEPVWLGFDPEHDTAKKTPEALWGQSSLAASEILSALIQFPEWFLVRSEVPLTGYQLKPDWSGAWVHVPFIFRNDHGSRMTMGAQPACLSHCELAPVVREC